MFCFPKLTPQGREMAQHCAHIHARLPNECSYHMASKLTMREHWQTCRISEEVTSESAAILCRTMCESRFNNVAGAAVSGISQGILTEGKKHILALPLKALLQDGLRDMVAKLMVAEPCSLQKNFIYESGCRIIGR